MAFPARLIIPMAAACCVLALFGCGGTSSGKGIISLAPNITETIFALDQGHRVIGVGDFDDYPRQVRQLPSLGGYLDPDLEQMTLMSPALIMVPGRHEQVTRFAELNEISVLNVHMDSLESIYAGINKIGAALGVPEKAEALCAEIQADLDAIREAVAPFERRSVFIALGRERGDLSNLQTAGGASFISELVEIAGGDNIYQDVPKPYLEASKETLVLKAPDAILEIHAGKSYTRNQRQELYNDWRFLDTVPAVRNGSIYFVTESHALRPGPRIADVARILARTLHFRAELPK